jgi:adenine-specific DNA-methyltransferase
MARKNESKLSIETLIHDEASRIYISTAEYQSVLDEETKNPRQVRYPRRHTPWFNELTRPRKF